MLTRSGTRRAIGPRRSTSRASWWLACALAALLAPLGPIASCSNPEPGELLNPRPEELPSGEDSPSPSPGQPQGETCDDNPLLAGCDAPDQDVSGIPITNPPASAPAPYAPESPSAGEGAASAADESGADAGVASDAGAP